MFRKRYIGPERDVTFTITDPVVEEKLFDDVVDDDEDDDASAMLAVGGGAGNQINVRTPLLQRIRFLFSRPLRIHHFVYVRPT